MNDEHARKYGRLAQEYVRNPQFFERGKRMSQYFCRFFRAEDRTVTTTMSVHATDLMEATAIGLRHMLPGNGSIRSEDPNVPSDMAAVAQTYSATIWKVPEDMKDDAYPHV